MVSKVKRYWATPLRAQTAFRVDERVVVIETYEFPVTIERCGGGPRIYEWKSKWYSYF